MLHSVARLDAIERDNPTLDLSSAKTAGVSLAVPRDGRAHADGVYAVDAVYGDFHAPSSATPPVPATAAIPRGATPHTIARGEG